MDCQPYSVLMSVYAGDDPEHFRTAVESMLAQTVRPSEVVIAVDGPVGAQIEVVLSDVSGGMVPVRIVRLERNSGAGAALMAGAPACASELIAIMDADDIARPNRMERQLPLFSGDPSVGLVGSWVSEFVNVDPAQAVSIVELPESHEGIVRFSKRRDPFRKPSVVMTKSALRDSGGFDGETPYYEDWDLFNRIIAAGYRARNVSEVLVDVRTGTDFFNRRGGVSYLRNTWTFTKRQLETGYFSPLDALVTFVPHAAVICMPSALRKLIYRVFLRKDAR